MLTGILLAAAPLLAHGLEDQLVRRDAGILSLPLTKITNGRELNRLARRQYPITNWAMRDGETYSILVSVGEDQETQTLFFDTGSAEMWVNPVCEASGNETYCLSNGRYGNSASAEVTGGMGTIDYGFGSIQFEYIEDVVELESIAGGSVVQRFGNGTETTGWSMGIFGAAPASSASNPEYPLFIDNAVEEGLINSRLFSVDINGAQTGEGSGALLYGGIDTKRFKGSLEPRPIIPASRSPDGTARFWINLDSLAIAHEDGGVEAIFESGLPVLVTTGYGASGFPRHVVEAIADAFPSATKKDDGSYEVDCEIGVEGAIDFTFGDLVINAPFQTFVRNDVFVNSCTLSIFVADDAAILGNNFLHSAYVVHDLDNEVLLLASAENCGSNQVILESGDEALQIHGECGQGDRTPTHTTTPSSQPEPSSSETTSEEEATATSVEEDAATTTSEEAVTTAASDDDATSTLSEEDATSTASAEEVTPTSSEEGTAPTSSEEDATMTTSIADSDDDEATATSAADSDDATASATEDETAAPTTTDLESVTSAITSTKTYVVSSCPPVVTDCPYGATKTEVVTSYTTFCPATKSDYVVPKPSSTDVKPPPSAGDDKPDEDDHGDDDHGDDGLDDKPDQDGHGDDGHGDKPDQDGHGDDGHSDDGKPDEDDNGDDGHGNEGLDDKPDEDDHGHDDHGDKPDEDGHGDDGHGDDIVSPPGTETKPPAGVESPIETPITGAGAKTMPAIFALVAGVLAIAI